MKQRSAPELIMSLDTLFSLATLAALAGWLVLLASPFAPRLSQLVAGLGITTALSVLYVALLLAFRGADGVNGSFGTLDGVAALFSSREILLAGWVHYLAFDLFLGAWQVRVARLDNLPFLVVMPCLALTFVAGPAGLLLFFVLRLAIRPHAGLPFPTSGNSR